MLKDFYVIHMTIAFKLLCHLHTTPLYGLLPVYIFPFLLSKLRFVDLFVTIFYHTDFKKSIHFHLIFGIVRATVYQILVCYFIAHEH